AARRQAAGDRLRAQHRGDPDHARQARVPEGVPQVGSHPPGRPGPGWGSDRKGARPRDPDPSSPPGADPRRLLPGRPGGEDRGRRCGGGPDVGRAGSRSDRRMMPAASPGGIYFEPSPENLLFVAIGLVVLFVFIVASRFVSRFAGEQLMKRHVRAELVVISRRIVTSLVIGLGLFAALSFAVQSANVALFGLVLATVVAALGVP